MPQSDRFYVAGCLTFVLILAALSIYQPTNPPAGGPGAAIDFVDGIPLDGPIVEGPRSPEWPTIRAEHIRKHPKCEACGTTDHVEVHHVRPFLTNPELELEPSNLISLCRGKLNHHFYIGHDEDGLDGPKKPNWTTANPNVRKDAAKFRKKWETTRP